MRKKLENVQLHWQEIRIAESDIVGNPRVSQAVVKFNKGSLAIMKLLAKLQNKKRLPANHKEIAGAMADWHRNIGDAFGAKKSSCTVINTDYVIEQLKK